MKINLKVKQPIFNQEEKIDGWAYITKIFLFSSPPRLITLENINRWVEKFKKILYLRKK